MTQSASRPTKPLKSFVSRSTAGGWTVGRRRLGRRLAAIAGVAVDREAKLGGGEERVQRGPAAVGELDGVRRMVADPAEADRHRVAGERDLVGRHGQPPAAA